METRPGEAFIDASPTNTTGTLCLGRDIHTEKVDCVALRASMLDSECVHGELFSACAD
jgi:hypothetical protein